MFKFKDDRNIFQISSLLSLIFLSRFSKFLFQIKMPPKKKSVDSDYSGSDTGSIPCERVFIPI